MRLVIIESPFSGNVDRNTRYLRMAIKDSLHRGEAPFASHGLYPGALNDDEPAERLAGMAAGWEWMTRADAVVVYADHGITPGMQEGINRAVELEIPIETRVLMPDMDA